MKHSAKKQQPSHSIRRWRDDREAILEFNRSITLIVDPSALTASIAARLAERFRADRIILLRAAPDSLLLEVAFSSGYDADDLKTVRLSQQDRMVKWMLTNESLLLVSTQARNQQVEIRFSIPAASAHILGDASRLNQLF